MEKSPEKRCWNCRALATGFLSCASYADRLAEDEELTPAPFDPAFDTIVTRQPCGVAALIVPWNWPLSILNAKLPQALIAGNTVVVKPAQNSAAVSSLTLKIIADLLPKGVVNVVTGSAHAIGDALVGRPFEFHRLGACGQAYRAGRFPQSGSCDA